MIWRDFESAAPELARAGRKRFERTRVALLATLQDDGSPRISPIEPFFLAGHLVIGSMRSGKARDLANDPRCAMHSSVTDIDASEGEFQLHGVAVRIDREQLGGADSEAWWAGREDAGSQLYSIDIERASLIEWDITKGEMRVLRWSDESGIRESRRPYP
jgi:hypothetical protein